MTEPLVPCTIAILTKNSAATLPRALESVQEFAEILICDGGSTDDTVALAERAGARILFQEKSFKSTEGRIIDFAGVRNQTLSAATEPWFFFLDSDEYLSDELVVAIRGIATTEREGAYWIARRYVYEGRIVDYAVSYPNKSMRLFARASALEFIKRVHERIKLKEGTVVGWLSAPLYVPVDTDLVRARRKEDYYIALQVAQAGRLPLSRLIPGTLRAYALSLRLLVRFVRGYLFYRGTKLPLVMEMEDILYELRSVAAHWRRWFQK